MDDSLHAIAEVGITTGVFCAMLSTGTSVPIGDVLQSLRDRRVIGVALVGNFIMMPLLALLLIRLLPMADDAQNALVLLGVCAGMPMMTRLTVLSKGYRPFSIGLMIILMLGTVIFAPLMLPLLLPHITTSSRDIASSLSVAMLVPLVLGLVARGRYPGLADLSSDLGRVAHTSIAIGIGASLIVAWADILGTIGSFILVASILLGLGGVLGGWLLAAGSPRGDRQVVALGTAIRNVPAALLIAGRDFAPETLVMASAGGLALRVVLMFVAGEMGRRLGADEHVQEEA